jgi:hypothetical protein
MVIPIDKLVAVTVIRAVGEVLIREADLFYFKQDLTQNRPMLAEM